MRRLGALREVKAAPSRPCRTSISTSIFLCSRRTAPGRRQPLALNSGVFPPKTGHERTTPTTHKPDSQELISPWSQVRIPPPPPRFGLYKPKIEGFPGEKALGSPCCTSISTCFPRTRSRIGPTGPMRARPLSGSPTVRCRPRSFEPRAAEPFLQSLRRIWSTTRRGVAGSSMSQGL